jgi:hypothetical protein
MARWWSRIWSWLFGRRRRPARGGSIAAPATLVARVESATDHDREILRLAEESLQRGFPEQAEIAYERAIGHYVEVGHDRKAVAVLGALSRLRPEDPTVFERLAEALERLERRADAARALRTAADRYRIDGQEEIAQGLVARARDLELRDFSDASRPSLPSGDEPEPAAIAEPGPPPVAALEPDRDLDDDAPLELPEDDVNSLILEALSKEELQEVANATASHPVLPEHSNEEFVPSMPGVSVHDTGAIEGPELADTDLDTDRTASRAAVDPFEEETPVAPMAAPVSAGQTTARYPRPPRELFDAPESEGDVPVPDAASLEDATRQMRLDPDLLDPDLLLDPEAETGADRREPEPEPDATRVERRPFAIPDDQTVYDPSGSAAMVADREVSDGTAVPEKEDGGTRITPNPQLAKLLESLRKKTKE